jgi:hypothetical protein
MIIGLGHKKGVGKTTVAKFLVENHGYKLYAFADVLKKATQLIFGFTDEEIERKDLINVYWGMDAREAFCKLGEALRQAFGKDVWCKVLLKKLEGEKIVIHDVRHPEEAAFIKELGGILWKIEPEIVPFTLKKWISDLFKSEHISERALNKYKGWDIVLRNDCSKDDLEIRVARAVFLTILIRKTFKGPFPEKTEPLIIR